MQFLTKTGFIHKRITHLAVLELLRVGLCRSVAVLYSILLLAGIKGLRLWL